ncbi:MAG: thioesterase family protein [Armatimonadetes bacterium]|nr:thioesterase family protein [Armatimonadota bacterium]
MNEGQEIPISVDPADIGEFGHASDESYLRYLDVVMKRAFAGLGWTLERFASEGCALVATRHELEFKQPARAGITLVAKLTLRSLRRTQLAGQCSFREFGSGHLVATVDSVWAWLDVRRNRPAMIPGEIVAALRSTTAKKD